MRDFKFYKELEASFWTDEDIDKDSEKIIKESGL